MMPGDNCCAQSRSVYIVGPFKGSRGVTQGDPLPPTMFNIVVDVMIRHKATVVAGEVAVPEEFKKELQNMATLFYMDNGIIASTRMDRLQEVLYVITGLFDW